MLYTATFVLVVEGLTVMLLFVPSLFFLVCLSLLREELLRSAHPRGFSHEKRESTRTSRSDGSARSLRKVASYAPSHGGSVCLEICPGTAMPNAPLSQGAVTDSVQEVSPSSP